MLKKLDHVIMVVNNLESAVARYATLLHLTPEGGTIRDVGELRIAMLPTRSGSRVELIEPKSNVRNRHAEFLQTRGEGVFGLSAFISDFDAEVKALRDQGITVMEETQPAVHPGFPLRLGWIPPEEANGVWIELVDAESLPPHLR